MDPKVVVINNKHRERASIKVTLYDETSLRKEHIKFRKKINDDDNILLPSTFHTVYEYYMQNNKLLYADQGGWARADFSLAWLEAA